MLPATFLFSDIMASSSDGSMRAHVDADAERIMSLDAEIALTLWDAQTAPREWLPVVAFNYSVTLYEEVWDEQTKRNWIDGNWSFIRQIGTPPAFSTALAPSGYRVADMVRPPQGWYAVETQTKQEMDEWISLMPELRLTYGERVGGPDFHFFVNDFITDDPDYFGGFIGPNDGPALVGRYGYIIQNGVVTPLANARQIDTITEESTATQVHLSTPGENDHGIFIGDWYAGEDERAFVGADQIEPEFITTTIDVTYIHEQTEFALDFIPIGQKSINPRFDTVSLTGEAHNSWFVNDGFVGEVFAVQNDAQYLIAQRLYLHDPTVVAQVNSFGFYVGDRIGMPLRTMELMIDLDTEAAPEDVFVDVNAFVGHMYVTETDTEDRERALRAVEAARGLADRVLVSFEAFRPLVVDDPITETTTAGAWVPNSL